MDVPYAFTGGSDQYPHTAPIAQIIEGDGEEPPVDSGEATYTWTFNDPLGEPVVLTGPTPVYCFGDNGMFEVTLTVDDGYGNTDTDTCIVTVDNLAPSFNNPLSNPEYVQLEIGTNFEQQIEFQDLGWLDTHTATAYWGDGSPSEPLSITEENVEPFATGSITLSHNFGAIGTYNATIMLEDDDAGYCIQYFMIEVFDPLFPPTAIIEVTGLQGYLGHYYNLPSDHPDMEGTITGIVSGDSPYYHDWYDEEYHSFSAIDPNLKFGNQFFPLNEGLPGDPYHFAVHWEGYLEITEPGTYSYKMGSDDDSWFYVDGMKEMDLGGIHGFIQFYGSVYLNVGVHKLDIFFAERHVTQSAFYFKFLDSSLEVMPPAYEFDVTSYINLPLYFDGSGSYDGNDPPLELTYHWDFGDGTTADGISIDHSYSSVGDYYVTLTVNNSEGVHDIEVVHISVIDPPPTIHSMNASVVRLIKYRPVKSNWKSVSNLAINTWQENNIRESIAMERFLIRFDASATDIFGDDLTYLWDFGDGTSMILSTGTVDHAYSRGNYECLLKVEDQSGCYTLESITLTIHDNQATFTM